jgi:hypothetical protein
MNDDICSPYYLLFISWMTGDKKKILQKGKVHERGGVASKLKKNVFLRNRPLKKYFL